MDVFWVLVGRNNLQPDTRHYLGYQLYIKMKIFVSITKILKKGGGLSETQYGIPIFHWDFHPVSPIAMTLRLGMPQYNRSD